MIVINELLKYKDLRVMGKKYKQQGKWPENSRMQI